jgi:hypothetical protein
MGNRSSRSYRSVTAISRIPQHCGQEFPQPRLWLGRDKQMVTWLQVHEVSQSLRQRTTLTKLPDDLSVAVRSTRYRLRIRQLGELFDPGPTQPVVGDANPGKALRVAAISVGG